MNTAPKIKSSTYKPALDGLRAISILFVLYGHLSMERVLPRSISATPLGLGGVVIFFAISGFLITSQLVSELKKSGSISLRHFYLRRGFRLFPALILFIAVVLILAKLGLLPLSGRDVAHALTYTMNFYNPVFTTLEHLWSLSVEEQFYLLWPLTLLFIPSKWVTRVSLCAILICPLLRALGWHWLQDHGIVYRRLDMVADTLAFGCFLSLNGALLRGKKIEHFLSSSTVVVASLVVIVACCALNRLHSEAIIFTYSLEGACAALMINGLAFSPHTLVARMLSWKPLVWLGQISYSLYLWQQIFLLPADMSDPNNTSTLLRFPLNLIGVFVLAILSYYLVELPIRNYGYRFKANKSVNTPAFSRQPSLQADQQLSRF